MFQNNALIEKRHKMVLSLDTKGTLLKDVTQVLIHLLTRGSDAIYLPEDDMTDPVKSRHRYAERLKKAQMAVNREIATILTNDRPFIDPVAIDYLLDFVATCDYRTERIADGLGRNWYETMYVIPVFKDGEVYLEVSPDPMDLLVPQLKVLIKQEERELRNAPVEPIQQELRYLDGANSDLLKTSP